MKQKIVIFISVILIPLVGFTQNKHRDSISMIGSIDKTNQKIIVNFLIEKGELKKERTFEENLKYLRVTNIFGKDCSDDDEVCIIESSSSHNNEFIFLKDKSILSIFSLSDLQTGLNGILQLASKKRMDDKRLSKLVYRLLELHARKTGNTLN